MADRNRGKLANKDIWIKLDDISKMIDMDFQWVKAHDDNKWNDYVDELARKQFNLKKR